MSQNLIFDIKRYAINDGPGIRIVIFFKGCNLSCAWCHNPESISSKVEKMYASKKCIRCETCVQTCPEGALMLGEDGIETNTSICTVCGKCAEACPTRAIEMSGYNLSKEEILAEIEKERVFFDQSGGGVTFSGGEPMLQSDFLCELLEECKLREIHTAIDTAGLVNTETLLKIAKCADLFLYDFKVMDEDRHKKWTGVSNKQILINLNLLAEIGARIIIRIPLIIGVNDDDENITQTAEFIANLSGASKIVNLIPYHNIAATKYQKLEKENDFIKFIEPTPENLLHIIAIFKNYGIEATIGG